MKRLSLFIFLVTISTLLSAQTDKEAIMDVMSRQQDCWNAGDLECFMDGYWKSDQLVFIGSKGLVYGWDKTLENYKIGYPDKEAMGKLTFDIRSLEPIGEDHWFMIGKWTVERKEETLTGHFSLVWRRLGLEWVIIADHSS
jgi:ketosteroid isomerase-like protein